jgi:thiamine transport system ATP-binding protein
VVTGTDAPRVEVEAVSVRFGPRAALDDVALEVAPGEVVAILGPSGSGKSTLLRAITGLQPLAAGRIRIDGRDQAGVPVHRRGVGLMFQDQALFPHRDVLGNVGFGLRMQGLTGEAVETRVGELLELVGLAGAERRPVTELSGGEQQRVALARSLAPAPRVLLLDEPLGALDRTLRERLVGDLRHRFTEEALTVLTVTHDQVEAFALADRIAIMHEARLVQVGTPPEVWDRPTDRHVAELLGLRDIVAAVVRDGAAPTPWGVLPLPGAPDGPADLLVRPGGVVPDPQGGVAVEVRGAVFQGARTHIELVVVEGTAPPLHADLPSGEAPARGERLRVRIDGAAVHAMPAVGARRGGARART